MVGEWLGHRADVDAIVKKLLPFQESKTVRPARGLFVGYSLYHVGYEVLETVHASFDIPL
jgi:hypothetical protein